jgi:hypothetical protein
MYFTGVFALDADIRSVRSAWDDYVGRNYETGAVPWPTECSSDQRVLLPYLRDVQIERAKQSGFTVIEVDWKYTAD